MDTETMKEIDENTKGKEYVVLMVNEGVRISDIISKATTEIVDGEFPTVHVEDTKKDISKYIFDCIDYTLEEKQIPLSEQCH